jgi:hypothetical protein
MAQAWQLLRHMAFFTIGNSGVEQASAYLLLAGAYQAPRRLHAGKGKPSFWL